MFMHFRALTGGRGSGPPHRRDAVQAGADLAAEADLVKGKGQALCGPYSWDGEDGIAGHGCGGYGVEGSASWHRYEDRLASKHSCEAPVLINLLAHFARVLREPYRIRQFEPVAQPA